MPPIFSIIWFFIPAAIANMTPVLVQKLQIMHWPVDLGWRIGQNENSRIFGDHKTWRGIFFGIIAAMIVAIVQDMTMPNAFWQENIASTDVGVASAGFRGLILGIGALGGDLIKSFFKRRLGIAPGRSWPIADQTDWVLGVLLVSFIFYGEIFSELFGEQKYLAIVVVMLFGLLHFLTNICGYFLGLRKELV